MDTTRVFRLVYRFSLVLFAVGVLGENEKPEPSKKEKTPSPLYEFREIHDRDGIGKFYFDREIAHVMGHLGAGWLERGSREVEEAPTKLIKALKVTAIYKALKPGGRVAFVEYRGEDSWVPIKPLHKMTQAQVKREAEAQGFTWIETLNVLPRQHIILVGK